MAGQTSKKNHYQIKTSYRLPTDLYRSMIYIIRHVYQNVLTGQCETPPKSVDESKARIAVHRNQSVKSHDFGEVTKDPTGNTAINRISDDDIIEACDMAWSAIPREYWPAVYDHIVFSREYRYMDYAHENTYKRYVAQYVWFVARNSGRI